MRARLPGEAIAEDDLLFPIACYSAGRCVSCWRTVCLECNVKCGRFVEFWEVSRNLAPHRRLPLCKRCKDVCNNFPILEQRDVLGSRLCEPLIRVVEQFVPNQYV